MCLIFSNKHEQHNWLNSLKLPRFDDWCKNVLNLLGLHEESILYFSSKICSHTNEKLPGFKQPSLSWLNPGQFCLSGVELTV